MVNNSYIQAPLPMVAFEVLIKNAKFWQEHVNDFDSANLQVYASTLLKLTKPI